MLKKITFTIIVLSMVFVVAGCKKTSEPGTETTADYKAQAQQEITKDNVGSELENLEKEIEADNQ